MSAGLPTLDEIMGKSNADELRQARANGARIEINFEGSDLDLPESAWLGADGNPVAKTADQSKSPSIVVIAGRKGEDGASPAQFESWVANKMGAKIASAIVGSGNIPTCDCPGCTMRDFIREKFKDMPDTEAKAFAKSFVEVHTGLLHRAGFFEAMSIAGRAFQDIKSMVGVAPANRVADAALTKMQQVCSAFKPL